MLQLEIKWMTRISNRRKVKTKEKNNKTKVNQVMIACSLSWIKRSETSVNFPVKSFNIWIRILPIDVEHLSTLMTRTITRRHVNVYRTVKVLSEVVRENQAKLSFWEPKSRSLKQRKRHGQLRLMLSSSQISSGRTFSLRCKLWTKWTINNLFKISRAS
jgi:hypothetical protein